LTTAAIVVSTRLIVSGLNVLTESGQVELERRPAEAIHPYKPIPLQGIGFLTEVLLT
jgi:hypothetical protein